MFKVGDKVRVNNPQCLTYGMVGEVVRISRNNIFGNFNFFIRMEDGKHFSYVKESLVLAEPPKRYRVFNGSHGLVEVFGSYEAALEALKEWATKLKDGTPLQICEVVDTYTNTRTVQLAKL